MLYIRGLEPFSDSIRAIEREHNIRPIDLARGLIEAACAFHREHGWFSFPVTITPKKFHIEANAGGATGGLLAAAETPTPYEAAPVQIKKSPVPGGGGSNLPVPPRRQSA